VYEYTCYQGAADMQLKTMVFIHGQITLNAILTAVNNSRRTICHPPGSSNKIAHQNAITSLHGPSCPSTPQPGVRSRAHRVTSTFSCASSMIFSKILGGFTRAALLFCIPTAPWGYDLQWTGLLVSDAPKWNKISKG